MKKRGAGARKRHKAVVYTYAGFRFKEKDSAIFERKAGLAQYTVIPTDNRGVGEM